MPPDETVIEREAELIADVMFALSSPVRVLLLRSLIMAPHSVTELMDVTGMEQSAVSHQLRVLRDYGLVTVERHGRLRVYAVADEHVASLMDAARHHALRRAGEQSLTGLLRRAT